MDITMQHNTVKIITKVSRVFAPLCDGTCPSTVLALVTDTYRKAAKLYYNTFCYNLHKQISAAAHAMLAIVAEQAHGKRS